MRIAICTDIYLPMLSGVADSVEILAGELEKRGHAVRIYAPDMRGVTQDPDIMRLPFFAVPGSGGGLPVVLPFGAIRDLRRFKPDVIHTQTFGAAGFVALYASWRLGVPLVGTDHTFPADFLRYFYLDFAAISYVIRRFASWYHNRCDFVTTPSQSLMRELIAHGFTKPHKVVSNHIPQHIFRPLPGKAALKKKFGIGSAAILVFGRIAPEKNLEAAVATFAAVAERSNAELVFVGAGPSEDAIRADIAARGLTPRTRFLGVLRGEALVEAINACEVFLITSLSETQSMTTLQSMACGLPVVVVRHGGLPEYVTDSVTGYVIEPHDLEKFADRLVELLGDPELRRRMGEAGRKSTERFSPEVITIEFEEIYKTALASSKAPAISTSVKISFVIPAYNEEKHLPQCLESVARELARTPCDHEVIVVNNASTDATGAIARRYDFVTVVDEPRKGLVRARAAGQAASTGEIIAHIDSDTLLPEGWLATVLGEFAKDEKLAALSGPYLYYDLPLSQRALVRVFYFFGYLAYRLQHFLTGCGALLQGGNFILRRSAIEAAGGFDTSIEFYGEDSDVARRVSRVGKVKWTFKLPMYTTGRRLAQEGLLTMGLRYGANHLSTLIFGKPLTTTYIDVRS